MQLELKFKSITTRWFVNIFLIVVVLVTVVVIATSSFYRTIYTERMESLARDYTYELNALSGSNAANFKDSAIALAADFKYKDKLEIQVLDSTDNILVSSSGFAYSEKDMPDYAKAKADKKECVEKIRTDSGERILAGSVPLYDSGGNYLGAYRWLTSMRALNRMTLNFVLFCVIAGFLILLLFFLSGIYFTKSIVRPIRDVSNIARKIAMGDFNSRIEISKNDEIGELCDTINYMASELDQAQNMKNDFISSVSHELRTPLTAIRGWGETAKMSLGTDEELVSHGLDVVLSEADRLSGLVEELLDFSRMESGRLSLVSRPLNITALLAESADMYRELARQQGIELVTPKPGEYYEVLGDSDRLKQVFINIIDNAVKYTENGGQVLISQIKEEGCVRITVTDTGVGIPAADIDRVKEKFYKANKTVRGSGIGLAVADEIVKQHKGLLFLESTEGAGTTVTVVLPLYEPEPEPEPRKVPESPVDKPEKLTEILQPESLDEEKSNRTETEEKGEQNG